MPRTAAADRKVGFKDCLIEVLRDEFDDEAWQGFLDRRAAARPAGGRLMAPLPPRASPTVEAILAAYEAEAGDGFREHLGASVIGRECDRALWYEFRWITRAAQGGRMLRLFETGRLEEGG